MLLRSTALAESACAAGISSDDIFLHCRGRAGDGWCVVDSLPRAERNGKELNAHCVSDWLAAIDSLPVAVLDQPGLGDMVAAGLEAIGVTKDRVQVVASAVGIKDCGCSARQNAMNKAGAKYLGIGVKKPIDPP